MWTGYLVFIQDKQPGTLYYRVYLRVIKTDTLYTSTLYYRVYQRVIKTDTLYTSTSYYRVYQRLTHNLYTRLGASFLAEYLKEKHL